MTVLEDADRVPPVEPDDDEDEEDDDDAEEDEEDSLALRVPALK